MTPVESKLPMRKQTRAKWIGYEAGEYFVTVCTENKKHFFGEIRNGIMGLSREGSILWNLLADIKFIGADVSIPIWIVMPNHFHAIVIINNPQNDECYKRNETILPKFIGRIKSAASREIHKINPYFGWQRSFHDRLVRTVDERNMIVDYITSNVERWGVDKYYCKHTW